MHCLEYCYCLITTIIISVLVAIIIAIITIMIIIIIIVIIKTVIPIWSIIIQIIMQNIIVETNLFPSLPAESFLPISSTKRCQPPKTEMKSKYETRPSCTLVNITGIKMVSQPAKPQEKIQITFKNNKFTRYSVPEHILLKRLNQFVITANVYLGTIKQGLKHGCQQQKTPT